LHKTPNRSTNRTALVTLAALFMELPALAQGRSIGEPGRETGKPNPLKNVYFGEQHQNQEYEERK